MIIEKEDLNSQLLEYISVGDLIKVKDLINQGANIEHGSGIALDIAIHAGNVSILDYLLKLNSELNFDIRMAFKKTIEKNHYEMYSYLRKKYQDNVHYSIRLAAKLGRLEIIQSIINNGYRCAYEHEPLLIAIRNDNIQVARLFLNHGMTLSKQKDDIINFCLKNDKLESLKLLVEYNTMNFDLIKQLLPNTRKDIKIWLNNYITIKNDNLDKDNDWIFKYIEINFFANHLENELHNEGKKITKIKL